MKDMKHHTASNASLLDEYMEGNDAMKEAAQGYTVVKRNGKMVPFKPERIQHAIEAAFRDTRAIPPASPLPLEIKIHIEKTVRLVVEESLALASEGFLLTVEGIQDCVEKKLMENGFHDVARDYILYRNKHKSQREDSPARIKVLRRDGTTTVRFNPIKVTSALERGFRDTLKIAGLTPQTVIDDVNKIAGKVTEFATATAKEKGAVSIEEIQDEIERLLMQEGFFKVAKDYIVYRQKRTEERAKREEEIAEPEEIEEGEQGISFAVTANDGSTFTITKSHLKRKIAFAAKGHERDVDIESIVNEAIANFYEGIKEHEVDLSLILAARSKVEIDPNYSYVAANLLLDKLYRESIGTDSSHASNDKMYRNYFKEYFKKAVGAGRLAPALLGFDLDKLAKALVIERDRAFTFLGLQTLYDRYLIHNGKNRLETPQIMWMRIAMGLALNEKNDKEKRTIEFYHVLSQFLFVSGTPTLFNSGTTHSQLSSCYLSTVMDDLKSIFKVIADNAQLSKWAGGLGNDWSNVRGTGADIKGTNGKSQGVIPFLKVANDTAVAVNQGGKRKGALCSYLETWHLDIEEFLELRKNTGDERRRTHDMNTANWIPDLFMKRVKYGGSWTLFTPDEVPGLHDLYGAAFEKKYLECEKLAEQGKINHSKKIDALTLWRKMLSMLFETGHPWITFKDPCNIRSPQDHAGVVHSSNLCTEIMLNTSAEETAVCNLGSVNLVAHLKEGQLDRQLLSSTIKTAIRMLDNVIDINFYPTEEARIANLRHRAVGLGLMGFQDALYELNMSYASHEAVTFADESMELISYFAILSSSELAKERGTYSTFKGSKWDRGLLPIDTIDLLEKERGETVRMDRSAKLDWKPVRESIKKHGMRNCNTMAIAPTATIANIIGVTQSIEPMYKHLFVKSNLSGEFTVINPYLVQKLKNIGLWDSKMVDDLKYFDGALGEIERIPEEIKKVYLTAFEIEPEWIIECGSRRQKWIDMGQSLNLYMAEPSGKKLHKMYMDAWEMGLKTTYYLRTLGATHIEKSTTDINVRGIQPRWMKSTSPSSRIKVEREQEGPSCNLDEECESCQ